MKSGFGVSEACWWLQIGTVEQKEIARNYLLGLEDKIDYYEKQLSTVHPLDGCRECEYMLWGEGQMIDLPLCNHPMNLQPKQRNWNRQKLLSEKYLPLPPAWCKLKEK